MSLIQDSDRPAFEHYRDHLDISNFPRGAKKVIDSMPPDERANWCELRFQCLKYPLVLGGHTQLAKLGDDHIDTPDDFDPIMGMDFQEHPHDQLFKQFIRFRPGEGLVLSDLSREIKKFMVLWSRGMFKTSSIIVLITQAILNYPNVRICFLTGGDTLAKRQLARVKRFFEKPTSMFKWLFPEFCTKSVRNRKVAKDDAPNAWTDELCKLGTAHDFTVPARTNETFAEPTFAISTARSVKAGSHFDIIFVDDLVNETNYRSVPLLEKSYQDYIDICPLLDPVGFMILTGTRYSFGDTYEQIQQKAVEEEKELGRSVWHFSIRDCWDSKCKNCGHRESEHDREVNIVEPPCMSAACKCIGYESDGSKDVLFPQVRARDGRHVGHTLEFLEGEKVRLGPEFFANQYENKPIATGSQTFTDELIKSRTLFDLAQVPDYLSGTTFMVGDLAYVGQPDRDYSVIFICRLVMGRIYVFDCDYGNWDSDAIALATMKLMLKHRPMAVYYEKFNGWEAYNNVILAKARELGIERVPLQWVKGSQSKNAKLARIGSVKGPLAAGRLWLLSTMKGYDNLTNQLIKWPKLGKHDDFADGLGQVVEAPTGYQLDAPPPPPSATHWLRQMNQSAANADSYYDNGGGTGLCM